MPTTSVVNKPNRVDRAGDCYLGRRPVAARASATVTAALSIEPGSSCASYRAATSATPTFVIWKSSFDTRISAP